MNYTTLTSGIPGISSVATNNLSTYLETLFEIGISIAAALAVIMIIIGGIQYMSTDAVGGKEEGKSRITSAVWGLLLALVSWLILNTINPQLVSTSVSIPNASVPGITPGTGSAGDPSDPNLNPPPIGTGPGTPGYVTDTSQQTQAYQNAAAQYPQYDYAGNVYQANNIALDTDGISDPGFDGTTHQGVTSYPGLNSLTDYYVAVPTSAHIPPGTPILVTDNTTGKTLQAVAGDNGATGWGEMSVASAQYFGLWHSGMGDSINQSHNITYTVGVKK